MSTVKPTTTPSKRLAASITAASTSFQLNDIKGWDGVDLTSASFGSVGYIVLRNETNTQMELASFDPTTIASSSITFLKRGLAFTGDLTTEDSTRKLTWIKGETIVELGSDTPQLFQWLKEYIDAASIAGAVNATQSVKGIVEIATSAEIDADTAAGSTGASISITPDQLASSKYGTRLPTANEKSAIGGNNGSPSSSNKLVTQTGLQNASEAYALDTGTANAIVVTLSPAPASLTDGFRLRVKVANSVTGSATINVNSLGVKTIKKDGTRSITSGDILASQIVELVYDGTYFQMTSIQANNSRKLYSTTTSAGTSGTSETDLLTTTIPGGLLGTSGVLAFKIFINATVRQDLTIKVYYGSSAFFTAVFNGGTGDNSGNGWIDGYIIASGATNTQEGSTSVFFCENGSEGVSSGTSVGLSKFYTATHNSSMAIDSTADQTFKVTGTFTSTTGSPSCEVYSGVVTYLG